MDDVDFTAKTKFISKFGLSLHSCGTTSHRIEKHLAYLSNLLGINGSFLALPTCITFVYWEDDPENQIIKIKRVQPGDGDLGLLTKLDDLSAKFEAKNLTFEQMSDLLDKTLAAPGYYGKVISGVAWMASSFCFSSLLIKNIYDAIFSAVAALAVYLLLMVCSKHRRFDNLAEIIATGSASIVLAISAHFGADINIPFCILSATILLVPGLSLTTAMSEMAHRDLSSGTARFVDASMSMIKLYLGALIGLGLGSFFFADLNLGELNHLQNLPGWTTFPALILLALAINIAFNIHPRFLGWCLVASLIAYLTSDLASKNYDQTTGVLLGAFAVGLFSNLVANYLNYPTSLFITTGIIFLVPGSKTYMLLNSWVTGRQMISDSSNGIQAFLIFVSLVAGILLANAVVPTRKIL